MLNMLNIRLSLVQCSANNSAGNVSMKVTCLKKFQKIEIIKYFTFSDVITVISRSAEKINYIGTKNDTGPNRILKINPMNCKC